jgi:hypothetical protein
MMMAERESRAKFTARVRHPNNEVSIPATTVKRPVPTTPTATPTGIESERDADASSSRRGVVNTVRVRSTRPKTIGATSNLAQML